MSEETMKKIYACPKCGQEKGHEIIEVDLKGKESMLFKCKTCGHMEYQFPDYDPLKEDYAVEMMGDAFREFLDKKKIK